MSAIQVRGLTPLKGEIEVQGSKNAVLPMMAATLLAGGTTVIEHVPAIADVFCMMGILDSLGCRCGYSKGVLSVDATSVDGVRIPEEFVGKMRSSVMVLGPLIARMGEAVTYYPGGCVLGKRPIDLHLYALRRLGALFDEAGGMIIARTAGLSGAEISFRFPSVGATENAVMAAAAADGTTVIKNCAMEPEIRELCEFLTAMGADISGAGGPTMIIRGTKSLHPCRFVLGADRIVAGTYLAAAVVSNGDVTVLGIPPEYLREPLLVFKRMGAQVCAEAGKKRIRLRMEGRPMGLSVRTKPYPGFPTDLQSPFLAVACVARGESRIEEAIFEERFAAANQMRLFGADIRISRDAAVVRGTYPLKPAIAQAPDLRGGAALVVAALAADGLSMIGGCGHIERGYEDICRDLRGLGADIETILL